MIAIERARRAELHKAIFNTAAPVLASAVSILIYQGVGGLPWVSDPGIDAPPVLCLLITNHLVSDASLVGVLSLSQMRPARGIWRAVAGRNLADDILVAPVIGFLAYAVVTWGFFATVVISATLVWVHKLYQTNRALSRLSSELLELMVTAIEARDPYTSGHSRRVSRLAMDIARCIGIPERDVKRIGVAGLLHDVGKIHEKYASILQKPDRLTKDEWLLMKEHPSDGEALIGKVSELHDILPAVRHHHERWDGAGYPDGLRGNAIPLMARVLTFADTIDAMTSTRPYRRGLTQEEVREEIVKCSGKQFDPKIAEALLASRAWSTLIHPVEADSTRYGLRLLPEVAVPAR
jgi:HD-GYP domain-containing protein (c-di-GMP phosphodiesterase class II)